MERLTERCNYGWVRIVAKQVTTHCGDFPCKDVGGCERSKDRTCPWLKTIDRLAAYEDTGLEPEDMKRVFSEDAILKLAGQALGTTAEHLRNLLSAEKDGRLWMSPVPLVARTKLYCPRKTDVQEQTLQYITLLDGEPTVSVSFECDYECDGCPHNAPYTNYDAGDGGCDGEGGFGLFNVSDVGKTVFLTREEAEAALGKERERGENT